MQQTMTCQRLLYYNSSPLDRLLGLLGLKVHQHLENDSVEGSLFSPLHPLPKLLISIKSMGIFSVCFYLNGSLFDVCVCVRARKLLCSVFILHTKSFIFIFSTTVSVHACFPHICSLFHFTVPQISFCQTFIKSASHISVALCNIILFILFQAASLFSFSTFIFHPIYLEINLLSNVAHSCVFYSCRCYTFILLFSVISSSSKSI